MFLSQNGFNKLTEAMNNSTLCLIEKLRQLGATATLNAEVLERAVNDEVLEREINSNNSFEIQPLSDLQASILNGFVGFRK